MGIGYDDTGYETYNSEKMKKKRVFVMKPLHFNKTNLIILIIIFTFIFLLNDYCFNNFGIDLEEEYKDYQDGDLMFGKKNMCQFVRDKYIYDVLIFKHKYISIAFYVSIFIILITLLYTTGILENIGVYIIDKLGNIFTINNILYGTGLFTTFKKLFNCSDEFFLTFFKTIF